MFIIRQNRLDVKKTMKIETNIEDSNVNKILSYSGNWFKLNDRLIRTNLVISKNHLYEDLLTDNFQDFALQHLQKITSWYPEIILIGTGKANNLPNFEWATHANNNNIGLEIMDTGAACRSYNLLIDEGRNVVACLFLANTT
jgi:uncharacterized protein